MGKTMVGRCEKHEEEHGENHVQLLNRLNPSVFLKLQCSSCLGVRQMEFAPSSKRNKAFQNQGRHCSSVGPCVSVLR